MTPRWLLVAALLFLATCFLALALLPDRTDPVNAVPEPVVAERPPEPPPEPARLPAPPVTPPRTPIVMPPRSAKWQTPRMLPERASREQLEYARALEELIPVIAERMHQCVADARVPLQGPQQVAIRIAAEPSESQGARCRGEALGTAIRDVYVRACLDDVMQELECPRPSTESIGAAVETDLFLRGASEGSEQPLRGRDGLR